MNNFFKDSVALIKNYKWNSIFFRYFKALIFVIIIPSLIFVAITFYSVLSSKREDIANRQRFDLIKSTTRFDKAYDNICDMANEIVSAYQTQEYMQNKIEGAENYAQYLNSYKIKYSYINSISVYDAKSEYIVSTYGSDYQDNFRDISWFELYSSGYADFSVAAHPKGIEKSPLFHICCNLLVNGKNAGIVIFTIDGDILTQQLYAGNVGQNEDILLFDNNNNLLYASNENVFNISKDKIVSMLEKTTYKDESFLHSSSFFYNAIASENNYFKLVSAISNEEYNKNFSNIIYIAIIYFMVTIILVIVFSLIVAFSFYRSIVDIVIKTSEISAETAVDAEEENNELVFLSDTLLNTVKNYQRIEQELVEKVSKLKKVQSIALQTQINPHFLFNTLNLVNGFILEECCGESEAATMLANLSDILYIALNTKEYIVSVETELEYAKKYLAIEQTKYQGKFIVKYDIDSETLNCNTVKFVLQPIIENAIEHGMKKITGKKGVIKISSAIMNNKLVLSVSDNGPKIPRKIREDLEKRMESEEIQETKHIGLSNVNQRIKLVFGKDYGVSIFSDDYETVIDIVMPVKQK